MNELTADIYKGAQANIEQKTRKRTTAQLGIECHKDKIYFQPVSHGVKFLGMYVYAYRKYTINRTIGRFIDRVNLCLSECENGMTEIRA